MTNRLSLGKQYILTYDEAKQYIKDKVDMLGMDRMSKAIKEIESMEREWFNGVPNPQNEGFNMVENIEALMEHHYYYLPLWFNRDGFPYSETKYRSMLYSRATHHFDVWFIKHKFKDYTAQRDLIILYPERIMEFWNPDNKKLEKFNDLKELAKAHARKNYKYLEMKGWV